MCRSPRSKSTVVRPSENDVKNFRASLLITLTLLSGILLAPPTDASVIVRGGAWQTNSLRTCWTLPAEAAGQPGLLSPGQLQHFAGATTPATDLVVSLAAARIREAADREFTVEATVAAFSTIDFCIQPLTQENYDLVLVIGRGSGSPLPSGEASAAGYSPTRTLPASIALAIPSAWTDTEFDDARQVAVEATSLHELAHILGLHEERSHPAIVTDPYQGPFEVRLNTFPVSRFDPNSIMLYNFVFSMIDPARFPTELAAFRRVDPDLFEADATGPGYRPALSRGDRHGLRCLYDPELDPAHCTDQYDPYGDLDRVAD